MIVRRLLVVAHDGRLLGPVVCLGLSCEGLCPRFPHLKHSMLESSRGLEEEAPLFPGPPWKYFLLCFTQRCFWHASFKMRLAWNMTASEANCRDLFPSLPASSSSVSSMASLR